MIVKKFEAPTLAEALAQVKSKFGSEALILSTQTKKGKWFGKTTVEVVASENIQSDVKAAAEATKPKKPEVENSNFRKKIPTVYEPRKTSSSPREEVRTSELKLTAEQTWMQERGFYAETAKEFARHSIVDYPKEDREQQESLKKICIKWLSKNMKTIDPSVFETRKHWSVVGAAGHGKTSLLVKLAWSLKKQNHLPLLISFDERKLMAKQELSAYAKVLGVKHARDKRGSLGKGEVELSDTTALHENLDWNVFERQIQGSQVLLVMDATVRLSEMLGIYRRVESLAPYAVAFTKLDLTEYRGAMFDFLKLTRLPLLGVSKGIRLSQDFDFMPSQQFGEFILENPDVLPKRGVNHAA